MKYLIEVVNKWNEHIKIQEEDLDDYEKDLAELYQPFPGIISLYKKDPASKQNNFYKNEYPEGLNPDFDPKAKKVSSKYL